MLSTPSLPNQMTEPPAIGGATVSSPDSGLERVRRTRLRLLGCILLFGAVVLVLTDGFSFPLIRDEIHFWRTSLRFSRSLVPPLDLLRDYGELNTPLPFLLNGLLEHLFHGGVRVARFVNFGLTLVILGILGWSTRANTLIPAARPVLGVLFFPYVYLVGLLAYTDVLGALFVLVGFVLHRKRHFLGAAVAFAAAIAARQYMLAFPIALAAHEIARGSLSWRERPARWLSPLLGAATLLGWVILFGGLGPAGETTRQVGESPIALFLPRNSLYSLAGIGFYFVIPEAILRWDARWLVAKRSRWVWLAAGLLALAFASFPPIRNLNFPIPTMGYLDRGLHLALGDVWKQPVFYLLSMLVVLRFWRIDLAFWCVAVHVAMMSKAHIAWDKYLFALIVLLWYLNARGTAEGGTSGETTSLRRP